MIPAKKGLIAKGRVMTVRCNQEMREPDMGTATPWFECNVPTFDIQPESERGEMDRKMDSPFELSFNLAPTGKKDRVRFLYKGTHIGQMATEMQIYRLMTGLPKQKLRWECSYDVFRQLQREAHVLLGCNLKRALRLFGCNARVKHTTKNGYWVWMK